MRLLLVQPTVSQAGQPGVYRHEVASLGGQLLHEGHTVRLRVVRRPEEVASAPADADRAPATVLVYVEPPAVDLAFRVTEALHAAWPSALVLFGPHAVRCPDECLSRPGVEAVAVARAEFCVPRYLAAPEAGTERLQGRGLWVNADTGVMRNPPPEPPANLADLPWPARELYGREPVLDAAGLAYVRVAAGGDVPTRGSRNIPEPLARDAWPVLHRPIDAVLREMTSLAAKQLDLGGFRIGNHRWPASFEWVQTFARRYPQEVRLPLRTTLDPRDLDAETARFLAAAGVEQAEIDVGSGSTLIRHDILRRETTPEQLEGAFAALAEAGIRSVARIEIGAPYETPLTLGETLELLRRLDPDLVEARLHFPAPGTASWEAARENGWLVPDPAAAHLAGRPSLALPALPPDALVTACRALPYAVHRPKTATLVRLARRIPMGGGQTAYERVLGPLLGPAVRRKQRRTRDA